MSETPKPSGPVPWMVEAAHDRQVQVRRCAGKVRFARMRDAERAVERLREDRGEMLPYGCPNCGGYHVGHLKPRR